MGLGKQNSKPAQLTPSRNQQNNTLNVDHGGTLGRNGGNIIQSINVNLRNRNNPKANQGQVFRRGSLGVGANDPKRQEAGLAAAQAQQQRKIYEIRGIVNMVQPMK